MSCLRLNSNSEVVQLCLNKHFTRDVILVISEAILKVLF